MVIRIETKIFNNENNKLLSSKTDYLNDAEFLEMIDEMRDYKEFCEKADDAERIADDDEDYLKWEKENIRWFND